MSHASRALPPLSSSSGTSRLSDASRQFSSGKSSGSFREPSSTVTAASHHRLAETNMSVAKGSSARSNLSPARSNLSPARSNLSPARSNLSPARSNLSPARSNLSPARSNLSPARSNLSPTRSNLSPTRSNLSPARSNLSPTRSNLSPARSNLSPARSNLSPARSNLSPARSNLSPTRSNLSPARSNLSPTRSNLSPARSNLSPARSNLSPARSNLSPTRSNLSPARSNLSPARSNLSPTRSNLSPTRSKSSGCHQGKAEIMDDPLDNQRNSCNYGDAAAGGRGNAAGSQGSANGSNGNLSFASKSAKVTEATPVIRCSSEVLGGRGIAGLSSIKRPHVSESEANSSSTFHVPNSTAQGTPHAVVARTESIQINEAPTTFTSHEDYRDSNEVSHPPIRQPLLQTSGSGSSEHIHSSASRGERLRDLDVGTLYKSRRRQAEESREEMQKGEEDSRRRLQEFNASTNRLVSEASRLSFSIDTQRMMYNQSISRLQGVKLEYITPKISKSRIPKSISFPFLSSPRRKTNFGLAGCIAPVKESKQPYRNSHKCYDGGAEVALALLKSQFMAGVTPFGVGSSSAPSSLKMPVSQLVHPSTCRRVTGSGWPSELTTPAGNVSTGAEATARGKGSEVYVTSRGTEPICSGSDIVAPHSSAFLTTVAVNQTAPFNSEAFHDDQEDTPRDSYVIHGVVEEKHRDAVGCQLQSSPPSLPLTSLPQSSAQGELKPPSQLESILVQPPPLGGHGQGSLCSKAVTPQSLSEKDKQVLQAITTVRELRIEVERLVVELLQSTGEWGCWYNKKNSCFHDLFVLHEEGKKSECRPVAAVGRQVYSTPVSERLCAPRDHLNMKTVLCEKRFVPAIPPPPSMEVILHLLDQMECEEHFSGTRHEPEAEGDSGSWRVESGTYSDFTERQRREDFLSYTSLGQPKGATQTQKLLLGYHSATSSPSLSYSPASGSAKYSDDGDGVRCGNDGEYTPDPSYGPSFSSALVLSSVTRTRGKQSTNPPRGSLFRDSAAMETSFADADLRATPIHPVFHAEATGGDRKHGNKGKGVGGRLKSFFSKLMCGGKSSVSVANKEGGSK